ncbi:hypothetical protein ACTXLD_07210 [Psychrobacter faecalis]
MKLSKAILASICLLPLVTVAYAEDVNTQNIRIVETTSISMNEATPSSMPPSQEIQNANKSRSIDNAGNDADDEADKEQGFRWPWQRDVRHKYDKSQRSSESSIRN